MFIPVTEDDYTRNKADPDAIVSLDANRNLSRMTAAQFESLDAFMCWKHVSDEDYHESHRGDWRYRDHTVSLGRYETTLSTERDEQERAENERIHAFYLEVDRKLRKLLTNKEYRRLKMFYERDLNEESIARIEGTSQPAISLSLTSAIRKAKKYFCGDL